MTVPTVSPPGVQKAKRPVSNKPHITDQVIFAAVLYLKITILTVICIAHYYEQLVAAFTQTQCHPHYLCPNTWDLGFVLHPITHQDPHMVDYILLLDWSRDYRWIPSSLGTLIVFCGYSA